MDKPWLFIGVILGIFMLVMLGQSGYKPVKWLGHGVLYLALGGIFLFLFNLVGQTVELRIPINPVTALVAGGLGLPGIAALAVMKLFLVP